MAAALAILMAVHRAEQTGRGRRLFGRGRPEPVEPQEVPREETGWLDDLRTAKQQRGAIGPGSATDGRASKSGKVAPGPDEDPDDDHGEEGPALEAVLLALALLRQPGGFSGRR